MKQRYKTPTLREKVEQYESLLHLLQLHIDVACNPEIVSELLRNVCRWSYAHRCGNGENSDRQQQQIINHAFYKLLQFTKAQHKKEPDA